MTRPATYLTATHYRGHRMIAPMFLIGGKGRLGILRKKGYGGIRREKGY